MSALIAKHRRTIRFLPLVLLWAAVGFAQTEPSTQAQKPASSRPSGAPAGKATPSPSAQGPTYAQLISAGYEFLRAGKGKEAYVAAAEAARRDRSRFEAYALAALIMHAGGADSDAQEFIEQAVALAPADKKAQVRLLAKEIDAALASSGKPEADNTSGAQMSSAQPAVESPEILLWRSIEDSTRSADYEVYLKQFPKGTFAALARSRVSELGRKEQQDAGSLVGSVWSGRLSWGRKEGITLGDTNLDLNLQADGRGTALLGTLTPGVSWSQIGSRIVVLLRHGQCELALNAVAQNGVLQGSTTLKLSSSGDYCASLPTGAPGSALWTMYRATIATPRGSPAANNAAARVTLAPAAVDRSPVVDEATPLVRIAPEYPPRAIRSALEGWVDLQFTITATGTVKDAIVLHATDEIFTQPALDALARWRYTPVVKDGVATPQVGKRTRIRFSLNQ